MLISLFFLSSGLFLGWSLGANDAANVFGTAVSTKMIRFRTAALICGIFIMIGAMSGGAGTTDTLGKLGSISTLAGAFTVALTAGITVTWMTKLQLPVSTSQAIVGAIIGWNIYSGISTSLNSLYKIISAWFFSPILAAFFAILLFYMFKFILKYYSISLLRLDVYTKIGLILIGIFGSYSLGANNIANVVGVFVSSVPFKPLKIIGNLFINPLQQLFFIGSLAIAVGVITFSKNVMKTIGNNIFRLSSLHALIVVTASSMVLFIFASQRLQEFLLSIGLPAIPLVPVSSSQAIVGAVLGIGITKSIKNINYSTLGAILLGWIATPVASGLLCYFLLFFMENVFKLSV